MKKFEVEVVKTDRYVIEFDETKINEQWMEEYRRYFTKINTLRGHAENIAQLRSRFDGTFFEGYGFPLINGKRVSDELTDIGINIQIVSEDEDVDVDAKELK
jgi:hypothetical protein